MLKKKRIIFLILVIILSLGLGIAYFYVVKNSNITKTGSYEDLIFDTNYVHEVNVEISNTDWNDLLANPTAKTKYQTNVTIDGEIFKNVSFATKGNSSLTRVASSDSDRYSFKLNFGKFAKGQTYHGANKLNLSNTFSDASYMKDYITYYIMRENKVEAPLVSYTKLSINGELYGIYAVIEEVDEAFLARNKLDSNSNIYKPETADVNAIKNEQEPRETNETKRPESDPSLISGADLVYKDDSFDSYSDIFNNAETKPTNEDKRKLISAIKALNTGGNVEQYWDIDKITAYFATHNFVLNYDSYTGTMLHNYYLLENNSMVSVVPWDYNEAYGAFARGTTAEDTTAIINWAINEPLSGTTADARPLWGLIINNPEYLALYHEKLAELVAKSNSYTKEIDRIKGIISDAIKTDLSAFYTAEQFNSATEILKLFIVLRSASISKQLGGELAPINDGRTPDALIDCSNLDLNKLNIQNEDQPTPPTPPEGAEIPEGVELPNSPPTPGQNNSGRPARPERPERQ